VSDPIRRFDEFQQSRPWLAFPVAVLRKFGDDQGGYLAALIAYYAFVSIFPLLLVSVAVLGFVLQGDSALQHQIVDSTLSRLPGIGDQLRQDPNSLHGSGLGLVIGVVTSLLAGMGITQATQSAFNRVWGIPFANRPNFLKSRVRGLAVLAVLALISLASFALTGVVIILFPGPVAQIGGYVAGALVNVALYLAAFRLLTVENPGWRTNLPGALVAAAFWQLLQVAGAGWAKHVISRDQRAYGIFGLVLGMLALLYLGSQVTVLAAEINVVRKRHLWPRSLMNPPLTRGDRRALRQAAKTEERVDDENVEVSFGA